MAATSEILAASRKAKKKKFLNKILLVLSGILILIGFIIGFFYIPRFRIKEISIEGAHFLDKEKFSEEISAILKEKFFKIFPYDNFLIFPKNKIIYVISEKFPLIKSAEIKRNFSQKLSVSVEERKPEALWCLLDNSCAFVDESGFIFNEAPFFSGNIFFKFFDERQPAASIGKQMVSVEEFKKIFSLKELLSKKNFNNLKIILKEENIYEIYFDEGWYLILNSKNDPYASFNNLELVLEANIKEKRPSLEYVDLRFGKKIYFKYK